MKQMAMITAVALLLNILSPAMAQSPGDLGSAECREAHLAVYDALESAGPPKNHGQTMKIVNRVLNRMKKDGIINGRCAACIRTQFAHKIPPEQQEPCGLAADARAIQEFVMDAFERFRGIVDPDDTTSPTVEFVGGHVEVTSESWVYVLDTAGRQVFRPTEAYPHMMSAFSNDIGPVLEEWSVRTVPATVVTLARQVALATFGADYAAGIAVNVVPARELLTAKCRSIDAIEFFEGRTMVLFRPVRPDDATVVSYRSLFATSPDGGPFVTTTPLDLPPESYETVVTFAPAGHLMRVESSFATPEVEEIAGVFREAVERGTILPKPYPSEINLKFGSFFSPEEPRLELTAYSWEGEKDLKDLDPDHPDYPCWETPWDDVPVEDDCNPFTPYDPLEWCYNAPSAPDVNLTIRPSRHYWADTFEWWNATGRKNGIRGNWDGSSQSWEIPVDIELHADLGSYGLLDPSYTKSTKTCEGQIQCPHSVGNKLEQRFYDDLESSHVVMINTHGGPIRSHRSGRDTFQFLTSCDNWVPLRDDGDDGLGTGRLRYLFLETCSNMNWRNNWKGDPKTLADDWLNEEVADGIRMVGGYDGGRTGWRISGWRFFKHYNLGDSVGQAWMSMALEENECHAPVVVAYGWNEVDARRTLFDGRFSKTRAAGDCAVVSGPLTEKLLEPRGCCLETPGPIVIRTCEEMTHTECEAAGGEPLDPCTNCVDDAACGCFGVCE
jgi:hypothetical protein